jgi:hypothetical protein
MSKINQHKFVGVLIDIVREQKNRGEFVSVFSIVDELDKKFPNEYENKSMPDMVGLVHSYISPFQGSIPRIYCFVGTQATTPAGQKILDWFAENVNNSSSSREPEDISDLLSAMGG